MSETGGRQGESSLIANFFAPLCAPDVAFGLVDDAAFLSVPNVHQLVLTKDMLVAGIHFFPEDAPDLIARKALRVNLSDLAAKGAKPLGYLLGLGLPEDWEESWLAFFCSGLKKDQDQFGFPLFGGDTVKSPERLTISVTAFGLVPNGQRVLRNGAKVGDDVYVTGTIGDSALGLETRQGNLDVFLPDNRGDFLTQRFMLPQPRTEMAAIVGAFASASMDISDGLIGDAAKLAKASNVSILIDQERVPLSPTSEKLVAEAPQFWQKILTGGDDYELLLTVDHARQEEFLSAAQTVGIKVSRIGHIREGVGVEVIGSADIDQSASYEHF